MNEALGLEISDFDRDHIEDILIDTKQHHSFSNALLRLIAKADGVQREVLRSVYPTHVSAFEAWQLGPHASEAAP